MKYRKAKLKDITQGEVFEDSKRGRVHLSCMLEIWSGTTKLPDGASYVLDMTNGVVTTRLDRGEEYQVVGKLCGDSGIELYAWFNIEVGDFLSDCLVPLSSLSKGEGKGYRFDPDLEHYPSNGTHYNSKWRRGDPLPEGTTHMLVTGK